jgi:NitT/TauT family transport system substrate-binding protein
MTRVRVVTAFHSPFYTPVHVARRLGAFTKEGLEVDFVSATDVGGTVEALAAGRADVAVSGPMRSYVAAEPLPPIPLVNIAEVNSRDGFVLLSRSPVTRFRWEDLSGRKVIVFAEAPTPWMCLLDVLRRHRVDPASIGVRRDLPLAHSVEAFVAGEADYLETALPVAEELLEDGHAHLAAWMGEVVGKIPYSSLMVTAETRIIKPALCQSVVTALARAQRWIAEQAPEAIAALIAADFPEIRPPLLTKIVARFQGMGTWPSHPMLEREPFERLGRILLDGGLIQRAAPFKVLADNTFAEAAMAALGG